MAAIDTHRHVPKTEEVRAMNRCLLWLTFRDRLERHPERLPAFETCCTAFVIKYIGLQMTRAHVTLSSPQLLNNEYEPDLFFRLRHFCLDGEKRIRKEFAIVAGALFNIIRDA